MFTKKATNHLVFLCFDSPEAEQQGEGLSIPVEKKLFLTIVWLSLKALKVLLYVQCPRS